MAAALESNHDFWRLAYDSHGPTVLGFLRRRMVGDEAEDVLQETFVRAIRAGSFERGGNLRAYLLTTARHVMINRLRRPRLVVSSDRLARGTAGDEDEDPLQEVAGDAASPEQDAAWSAFRGRLDKALAKLPPAHRQAFELAILEQHSYAEIAQMTGWSPSQVKINIYRARQRVIAELADYLPARAPGEA